VCIFVLKTLSKSFLLISLPSDVTPALIIGNPTNVIMEGYILTAAQILKYLNTDLRRFRFYKKSSHVIFVTEQGTCAEKVVDDILGTKAGR